MDAEGARALKRRIEQYQAQRRLGLVSPAGHGNAQKEPEEPAQFTTDTAPLPLEAWIGFGRAPDPQPGSP